MASQLLYPVIVENNQYHCIRMEMCAICGQFAGSSSYRKLGMWADLFSTEQVDRHGDTGSIPNNPHLNYGPWSHQRK